MLGALWWMGHCERKVIPALLLQEGWLDRDDAERVIRQSSAFPERLKEQAQGEFAMIDSPSHGERTIARDRMLDRREREVMMQMRREYTTQLPAGLAGLDLYYGDTLGGMADRAITEVRAFGLDGLKEA